MSTVQMEPSWLAVLEDEFSKPYIQELRKFLQEEQLQHKVYPPNKDIFNAFWSTPFNKVRVVILGQDPYHGPGEAHGLSFSVQKGIAIPPSLRNMYKELQNDLQISPAVHGNLQHWAEQGILLLNTVLTVRHKTPNSHQNKGWEQLTDRAIAELSAKKENIVFILWGSKAKAKSKLIDTNKHHIIHSAHPSPLSAHNGFLGSKPYSKTNTLLTQSGLSPIDWKIPD